MPFRASGRLSNHWVWSSAVRPCRPLSATASRSSPGRTQRDTDIRTPQVRYRELVAAAVKSLAWFVPPKSARSVCLGKGSTWPLDASQKLDHEREAHLFG